MDVRHRVAQWRVQARTPTGRWRRLPDLLVIGGQRCGTSTLYRHLGRHPDVSPSLRKEVEYFSRRYDRGDRWYRAHFALDVQRDRLSFEATPDYLFHPLAAARAATVVPDARLVVMLRDPVARAWSHYHHMVGLGHEHLDFDAAVTAEPDRCADDLARLADNPLHDPVALLRYSYVARGRYAEQLARWFEHFPRTATARRAQRGLLRRPRNLVPADPRLRRPHALGTGAVHQRQPPAGPGSPADPGRDPRPPDGGVRAPEQRSGDTARRTPHLLTPDLMKFRRPYDAETS